MDRKYASRIEPGLRVIVTAGGAGIGRVIVEALHTCGAHIHVCDVDADAVADLNSALPKVGTSIADVADASQVDRFFAEAEAHLAQHTTPDLQRRRRRPAARPLQGAAQGQEGRENKTRFVCPAAKPCANNKCRSPHRDARGRPMGRMLPLATEIY